MSKLWLNVIIAIDNSFNMGLHNSRGLRKSVALLEDVFKDVTVGQLPKQQTTVGLISYSKSATILANLTTYGNFTDLQGGLNSVKAGSDYYVGLAEALKATSHVIRNGYNSLTRQTVLVLIASAYSKGQPDPSTWAGQLKTEGVKIMTIAVVGKFQDMWDAPQIAKLASPDLDFVVSRDSEELPSETEINDIRRTLCEANCFCRNNWIQFSSDFKTIGTRYGECLMFATADAIWYAASQVCHATAPGAYLATEYSAEKHKFNYDYVRSVWDMRRTPTYFVGLSYQSSVGGYAWEQPRGQPLVPLEQNDYAAWGSGFPDDSGAKYCVEVVQIGFYVRWQNVNCFSGTTRYICQVNACDTDNYCENSL